MVFRSGFPYGLKIWQVGENKRGKRMIAAISTALTTFEDDLGTVAGTVLPIAAAGLIVWVGWRLACKLTNRGVGK